MSKMKIGRNKSGCVQSTPTVSETKVMIACKMGEIDGFFVGGTEGEKNGSNSRSLCGELWVEINRTQALESDMKGRIDIQ